MQCVCYINFESNHISKKICTLQRLFYTKNKKNETYITSYRSRRPLLHLTKKENQSKMGFYYKVLEEIWKQLESI